MAEGQFEPSPASREGGRRGEGLKQTLQKTAGEVKSNDVRFHLSLLDAGGHDPLHGLLQSELVALKLLLEIAR